MTASQSCVQGTFCWGDHTSSAPKEQAALAQKKTQLGSSSVKLGLVMGELAYVLALGKRYSPHKGCSRGRVYFNWKPTRMGPQS